MGSNAGVGRGESWKTTARLLGGVDASEETKMEDREKDFGFWVGCGEGRVMRSNNFEEQDQYQFPFDGNLGWIENGAKKLEGSSLFTSRSRIGGGRCASDAWRARCPMASANQDPFSISPLLVPFESKQHEVRTNTMPFMLNREPHWSWAHPF